MKDKWMNVGYEDDELKPYQEPSKDCTDPVRIGLYQQPLLCCCGRWQFTSELDLIL